MRKRSKIYEYIEKLKEKRKKRTEEFVYPSSFDFSAGSVNTTDVKPQKREEERSEFNPILPRYYKGYDIDILLQKEEDECLTEKEAFILKEAQDHYYRKLSEQSFTQIAKKLFPAVYKGKSTFELFEKIENDIPLTEEEDAFYWELCYEYVEKPQEERSKILEQQQIEAIKAGKISFMPTIRPDIKLRPIEEIRKIKRDE